jgi:hypothetical protein
VREQQYVGIDLHRGRSVIVRMNDAGEGLGVTKVANDRAQMSMARGLGGAGVGRMLPGGPIRSGWLRSQY